MTTYGTSSDLPSDYSQRVKNARAVRGLTQAQFAGLVGVSFATVNRWENGQTRPNKLAWSRILELENSSGGYRIREAPSVSYEAAPAFQSLDFSADPDVVSAVAEAHRLTYGHLFNSAFATETSLIDPLPHQYIAVYQRMLDQSPLRFLLADDAGAGKTIMTGLYAREMLARRLIRRVLIVPPAGLVGNWEQELRSLFRLQFRIVGGADARAGNPFIGPESDRLIVSMDTLAGARMFGCLKNPETEPYDLVVFDEAHKLSADREPDFRVRKTARYRLAEAIAGADVDGERWALPWSTRHLLLLTATPHMGKDYPYYFLWRLLLPDALSTYDAFADFPEAARRRHFIRRAKEEMVHFDESPLYPQRHCGTLSYDLTQGIESEQELYDETTHYIKGYYNRARFLNRSAARLAMSVFQRRLASSTYALRRSFERRKERLEGMIEDIRSGRLTEEQLARQQMGLDNIDDIFETQTADEYAAGDGEREQQEEFEDKILAGAVAVDLAELEAERLKVAELLDKARNLGARGEESKFEKLREVLRDPDYADEKFIIFTEHRDTALFLIRRLEGLGFTGRVALIHGGMPYPERERQVEFFRRPTAENGANYLVATDAAGEGINLQFCWLMVNYDIPWNPARLEQRMGRIHRYGQTHDPVIIVNLVAGATREGRVLKTLLDKLETVRRELGSDKVFDVIGRLFEDVSMKNYLERAVTGEDNEAMRRLEGSLTREQVLALRDKERSLYGAGGEVARALPHLREQARLEDYRRLIPGYVRRFVEKTAPLLDLRIEGDAEASFRLAPNRPGALDPLLVAFEMYPEKARTHLSVRRPQARQNAIWVHPGEPVFERLVESVSDRYGNDGLRGAVFIDPYAKEEYLFHIALVSVERGPNQKGTKPADKAPVRAGGSGAGATLLDLRLVGLRQRVDGASFGVGAMPESRARSQLIEEWPVEHLLLLKGAPDVAPGQSPLAALARRLVAEADGFVREDVIERLVQSQRQRILDDLPSRLEFSGRGFDFQAAELAARRAHLNERARGGDLYAKGELAKVKERQRSLTAARARRLAELQSEAERVRPGAVEFLVHALVVPAHEPEDVERFDVQVESMAMEVATAYEERFGAHVQDVSLPELARRAGLPDWPGFDLLSCHAEGQRRHIEVKGRARSGSVEVSDNEWGAACNLRNDYWLYVVFDCATPHPRLVRVRDPFAKLLANSRESHTYSVQAGALIAAAE